jgi:selenocysteine lyase/cysteine desulfurase
VAQELAERGGIGVRSGCHCAHMLIKHLLKVPPLLEQFQGAMLTLFRQVSLPGLTRISLGLENSAEEIDTLLQVLRHIAAQPRSESNGAVRQQMDNLAQAVVQRVYRDARPSTT